MKTKLVHWNAPSTLKQLCDLFAQARDYILRAVVNGDVTADTEGFTLNKKKGTLTHRTAQTVDANVEDAKLVEAIAICNPILKAQSVIGFKFAALRTTEPAKQTAPSNGARKGDVADVLVKA